MSKVYEASEETWRYRAQLVLEASQLQGRPVDSFVREFLDTVRLYEEQQMPDYARYLRTLVMYVNREMGR